MHFRVIRRIGLAFLGAGYLLVAVLAGPASADAAGPTDYNTEVTAIDPAVDGVVVGIVGGDAFVSIDVDPGVVVEVVGYNAEPFLRIEADGTVRRNELSPTRWLSEERYGNETPDIADPLAPPEWVAVGENGTYLWHDHRAHWMNPNRPPGAEPGDTILEGAIPIVVDGVNTSVEVRSVLLAGPSAPWLESLLGVMLTGSVLTLAMRTSDTLVSLVIAAIAILAGLVGWWAYQSVPSASGPSLVLWAPAAAAAAGGGVAAWYRQNRPADNIGYICIVAVACVELAWWAWARRHGLTRAYIPTNAPYWLERGVTAAAGTASVGGLLIASARVWTRRSRTGSAGLASRSARVG